jgi:mannose-6-phosphate isomerase-like protein (cupin superfamily)
VTTEKDLKLSDKPATSTIPPDDMSRDLTLVGPDQDAKLKHIALASDIYTILLSGEDTANKFCLIDMQIPPGGGPRPHRHDFEETFTVLEGECVVNFRDRAVNVRAGETAKRAGKRTALHPQCLGQTGARPLHLRARWPGRVLPRRRRCQAAIRSPRPSTMRRWPPWRRKRVRSLRNT